MIAPTQIGRGAKALAASALLALAVSACALQRDPQVALAAPDAPAPAPPAGRADVKTVRPTARTGADEAVEPVVVATPSPRQIFDFHPAGGKADDWRQPFIIDPNDGPLAADVRRSAAELRDFLAASKRGATPAVARRCGESEVATGKRGCAAPTTTGSIAKPAVTGPAAPTP